MNITVYIYIHNNNNIQTYLTYSINTIIEDCQHLLYLNIEMLFPDSLIIQLICMNTIYK